MKIYIAGPMTGIKDYNFPEFNRVAKLLREKGYEAVNPAELDGGSTDKEWEWYMKNSLKQMLDCDGIALLSAWSASKGANIEINLARELSIPVKYYTDWIKL